MLVDGKCLLQELRAIDGVAVEQAAAAYSFERPGFFQGGPNFACQCQRLGVVMLAVSSCCPEQGQLAKVVENFCLTSPVTRGRIDGERSLVTIGRPVVITRELQRHP